MKDPQYSWTCEICGTDDWTPVYTGPMRDGSFGSLTAEVHTIYQCTRCTVQRLEEAACKDDSFYAGKKYRELLGESSTAEGFWNKHDIHQLRNLNMLWPHPVRSRIVADAGCAAGSLLDHISGLAAACLAIEPCREYHPSLRERGFKVYDSILGACDDYQGQVDIVFSLATIEHVAHPSEFFSEIRQLLKPGGLFLVSTPNRQDLLMDLLGDEYQRFFYRTVHRWYFDMASLINLAERCNFEIIQQRCVQRFGISNALSWLRDRKPTGDRALPGLDDPLLNLFWKNYLESKNCGDYLYLLAGRGRD
jgi:2-polyprenyl-3-methyl-5-hydroxy-6-metoxy-1,4-benzoquinol methylase